MTPALTASLERAIKEAWPNWPEQFSLINGYEENQVACWKDDYGEWIRIIDVHDIDLFIIAATAEAHWLRKEEQASEDAGLLWLMPNGVSATFGTSEYDRYKAAQKQCADAKTATDLWANVGRLIEKKAKL